MKKISGRKFFDVLNVFVMFLAVLSVQSTCVWVHHQPKVPEQLKKRECR